jgi:hypothetical protein
LPTRRQAARTDANLQRSFNDMARSLRFVAAKINRDFRFQTR